MEQNNDATPTETIERPQFLKVLCILTFIGCGLGILGSVFGWWSLKTLSALMENDPDMFEKQMNSPWANPESTMLAMKFMNENLITGVLGSITLPGRCYLDVAIKKNRLLYLFNW